MKKDEMPTFLPDADPESVSSDVAGFGGFLVSTQIPTREDGSVELGDLRAQARCTLQSLRRSLERAGSSMSDVLHLTVYLTDMSERPLFNEVYREHFTKPYPVRCAIGVSCLAIDGMRVEVTALAAKNV